MASVSNSPSTEKCKAVRPHSQRMKTPAKGLDKRFQSPSSAPPRQTSPPSEDLVGRPLVPFFVPDSESSGDEVNIDLKVYNASVDESMEVPVRHFENGYFTAPKPVAAKSGADESCSKPPKGHKSKVDVARPVSNRKTTKALPNTRPTSTPESFRAMTRQEVVATPSTSSTKFAGPSFKNSPSPDSLPMPSFLSLTSPKEMSLSFVSSVSSTVSQMAAAMELDREVEQSRLQSLTSEVKKMLLIY
eukprot:GILK01003753.1.p1 GENE.GILK01003753.1~~GILK01003753.1.p1  ORF type:complete len:245 (-),score=23.83 GILK01003753.1:206-940(-)